MTIGARRLLDSLGSRLAVAEALLQGKIGGYDQQFVNELVTPLLLEAARIKLLKGD